jgi:hypothetical protein
MTTVAGRKDDSGKLDVTLLLDDCPNALLAITEVMQWAITQKKPTPYDRGSWQGVAPERYRAAAGRHLLAAAVQAKDHDTNPAYERDAETNLLHLAHRACSVVFELELVLRQMKSEN